MTNPSYSASIVIARPAELLYDMISDVTRMGEWSPVCKACWWDDGDGPRVRLRGSPVATKPPSGPGGARSEVVVAERGQELAFVVGDSWVRWGYTFSPVEGGTRRH